MRARAPNIGLQRTSACGLAAEAGSFGVRNVAFGLIVVLIAAVAAAQTGPSIEVVDQQLKTIPGATVVLDEAGASKPHRRFEKRTDAKGVATFGNLAGRKYVIRVSLSGYIPVSSAAVALGDSPQQLKFVLNIAPVGLGCEEGDDCFKEYPLIPPRNRP